MKIKIGVVVGLVFSFVISAQSQVLKDINTIEEAEMFVILNRDIKAEVKTISFSRNDDSLTYYKNKIAALETLGKAKLLVSKPIVAIKVNYVFFDGTRLTMKEINEKRAEVLQMHKKGISSDDLVRQFTMDTNIKPGGNFGWINENDVDSTFVSEIKKHKKGDIFIINIPEKNWYYVVFKLYDDQKKYLIQYIEIIE